MRHKIAGLFALILAAATSADRQSANRLASSPPHLTSTSTPVLHAAYGNLPMRFEKNQGQTDAAVDFISRGSGYAILLTPTEAVVKVRRGPADDPSKPEAVLRLQMAGSNERPAVTPLDRLPGDSNYLIGKDPAGWRTSIPNYAKVRYNEVYPGIDLVYYGNQKQLEYDFVVSPGANPSDIKLTLEGANRVELAGNGDLVARVDDHDVRFNRPVIYQDRLDGSGRDIVEGRYDFDAERRVAFDIGAYDATRPLVIDPVLSYSTYVGGTFNEGAHDIAVDATGNAYVTGYTGSTNFPVKAGSYKTSYQGSPANPVPAFDSPGGDVFVVKLNNAGSALVYSTFLGGTDHDAAYGIAVDSSFNAYVTGSTNSIDFPTSASAFQPQHGNSPGAANVSAFVAKLNPAGTALVYSTYLSGHDTTRAAAIAVDSTGNAYVAGGTSIDFPTTTPGGFQATLAGGQDVFVAKVGPAGSTLVYSRLIGGLAPEEALGIAVDGPGNAWITGTTSSTDYPLVSPFQGSNNGQRDAFVTKLNTTGVTLLYSTYMGADALDVGRAITVDAGGSAYVVGFTAQASGNQFFTSATAVRRTNVQGEAFAARFSSNGTVLYSTFLGGGSSDEAYGVAVDNGGNAYISGMTCSTDFLIVNPVQTTYGGTLGLLCDAFASKLNIGGNTLLYSTYVGGTGGERATAIAVDSGGSAYLAGMTTSQNFPTAPVAGLQAPHAIQGNNAGGEDVFVAKIANVAPPTITAITPTIGTTAGGTTVTVTGSNFLPGVTLTLGGTAATNVTIVNATTLTARTPAHAAGLVDVVVANPDIQAATITNGFRYGPGLLIDRTSLLFGGTKPGATLTAVTAPQDVTVTQTEGAAANWTATASQPWVQITSGTGSGPGRFKVGIIDHPGIPPSGSLTATVTVASNLPVSSAIGVTLTITGGATLPAFGNFDTPAEGATNVTGAVPVTGWALDDLGVVKVQLWRNCVEAIDRPLGACTGAAPGTLPDFVYIGDVAFLPGARPDVEAAAGPNVPQNYKAGWGYLMSTNALPHVPAPASSQGGQGTFTLYAYAIDIENNFTLLGTKTITLNNDNADIPFGSIDTPDQGGTMTVSPFASFGWAMTQNPKCIITSSLTAYRVYIDGVQRTLTPNVNWFPGLNRPDIAAAHPGRCNSNDALAAYYIDVAALGLQNGLHTTGWDVIDNQGKVTGIGSRFFDVLVGSSVTAGSGGGGVVSDRPAALGHTADLGLLAPAIRQVQVQIGGDETPKTVISPNTSGTYAVQFPAGGRIAFDFDGPLEAGFQVVGEALRALPVGSTFDAGAGTFAWQPAVPFMGPFHLVFLSGSTRLDVRATIVDPTKSAGVSMHIDTPGDGAAVGRSFIVAGWALDRLAATGSGIDTLHVWAYRRDGLAPPQFLGAAAVGGPRPDVASIFGDQFDRAGFTLTTPQLAPGDYDLLVYPWSRRTGRFEAAQSVGVVVR